MGRIRPAPWLIAAALALSTGCPAQTLEPEQPAGCLDGEHIDGDTCVPVECGLGEWGDLPALAEQAEAALAWVAPWGDRDWPGTADQPFDRIKDGAQAVTGQGGGLVLVASGVYDRNLSLSTPEAGARIIGRCAALTVIDGHDEEEPEPAVSIVGGSHTLERLTIRGGLVGVQVMGGLSGIEAALRDVVVTGSTSLGLLVGGNAAVDLEDVLVTLVEPDASGLFGRGIDVESGALLTGRRVTVQDVASAGIFVAQGQARVELEDSVIRRVVSTLAYQNGEGVAVMAEGQAVLTGVLIEQVTTRGVSVFDAGSEVELTDCTIRDIGYDEFDGQPWEARGLYVDGGHARVSRLDVSGTWMGGVVAQSGGFVEIEDSRIEGDRGVGVAQNGGITVAYGGSVVGTRLELVGHEGRGAQALHTGSEIVLTDSVIRDTLPLGSGGSPSALSCMAGGAVTASGLQILNTQGVGALVSGGAMLLEDSVVIGGTSDPGGEASGGVAVVDGGLFEGRRLLVSDVVGPGISSVGHGSRVVLEDVEVEGVRPAQPGFGSGLEVAGEAHAEARGLTVRDCQPHGVSVTKHHVYEGAPTLLLEDATIEGTSAAAADGVTDQCIVATEAAGLVLRRVEASGCTWAGLEITGWAGEQPALLEDVTIRDIDPGQVGLGIGAALIEAPATLVRLEIEDVYAIGLFASGPLAAVTVQDSAIHRVEQGAEEGGGVGLVSQYMARVTATGLVTEHNDGPGIYALARGNIDCQDCIARGNGFAGVAVTDGGALRLTGGTIEASPATLTHGGGVGLFAWRSGDGPWLSMHGVEIRGHLGPAVYLRGRGTYLLRDSVFDGNGTSAWSPAGGVLALDVFDRWDPDYPDATDGGLMLSGNTFSDTDHDAVLLHAATASFYDNDWNQAADALDVRRQACDGVPPLDLYGAGPTQNDCEGPAIEVSPALEYRLEIEEAGLEE